MADLSDSTPSVLDGYISEDELGRQLHRSVRTLQRLAARRSGSATHEKIGRLIFYNVEHVRDWLSQQEPRKPVASVRHHANRQLRRG